MKRNLILLLLALSVLYVKGQILPSNPGDTIGMSVISFDVPTQYVTILPLQNNIWQIGGPHKTFFDAPYTPPNVIVTDTINDYPINNLSTFELIVGSFNLPSCYYDMFIDFRHKYDCDTLRDGGYISVSWDGGLTWNNIITDPNAPYEITPTHPGFVYGNNNLYNSSPALFNGEPGFTGHSGGWIHSCMAWYDIPVKKQKTQSDTIRFHFTFVSDSIQNNREGWMIDQIRLFDIDLGSGIKEYQEGKTHSYFYPNPIRTTALFIMNRTYHDVHYELMDGMGLVISKSDRGQCDEFTFDRTGLLPGNYFMRLFLDDQLMDIHRIIVTP